MHDNLEPMANREDTSGISVHAGFPNPAADSFDHDEALALNINQLLIRHPSSTYLFRISGEQWAKQGIYDGDIAIIDRAIHPQATDLVVSWELHDFCLQPVSQLPKRRPAWGVVTAIIHHYTRG